ncbi:MAG: MoaD/ThiS family protein, partial [Rudaea sp.]|nr:MoaD/ThiS family protein [Rudaea sp.]
AEECVALPGEVQDVAGLIALLAARGGVWADELGGKRVFRVAINQDMVCLDAPIPSGAEVAIFPPVTGG